ncbi:N-terminal EF-hand calcium-binding protein 3-like, partial [Nannospalax galili]|uniref:N-terminal EF-hand calcium-binding protein 3-like n=1 Tax=Nannospalax galili TaxID=1026970 RepID=UPI0004ED14F9
DGKLSFEEFQNYFADGVLSPGELRELFSSIDGHLTDNLETEKLCDYFSKHLGVYRPVLAALESLNRAVLTAMDTTKLVWWLTPVIPAIRKKQEELKSESSLGHRV